MTENQKTSKNESLTASRSKITLPIIVVLAILLCGALAGAGYFYYQYKNAAKTADLEEIDRLTKTIGALIELPTGETPTLATVTDKDKLAEQPFFQRAENGDKVLIYANSGRAILYRPSTKKIVDVTTVNINQPTPATASDTTTSQTTKAAPVTAAMPESNMPNTVEKVVVQKTSIALYNGSTKIGVTNTLEDEIKTKFSDVEVIAKEKAAKNDYQGNLVIDLSGTHTELTQKLAENIGGTVGTLPANETKPAADILVVVGNKQ
jgi:hypothetical protein